MNQQLINTLQPPDRPIHQYIVEVYGDHKQLQSIIEYLSNPLNQREEVILIPDFQRLPDMGTDVLAINYNNHTMYKTAYGFSKELWKTFRLPEQLAELVREFTFEGVRIARKKQHLTF